METKEKIHLTILLMLFGSFIFLLYAFFMNRYADDSSAYDSFLFIEWDKFMDFFNVNYFIHDLSPYTKDVSYPPFALLIAYPFSIPFDYMGVGSSLIRDSFWGMMSYVLLVFSFFVSCIYLVYKLVKDSGTITTWICIIVVITSYPVLFLLDRGNYLMITFVLMLIFITCYTKYRRLSLFCLSAAIALKLYPALFLILLVCDRRYKDTAQTVVAAIFLSFFPLLVFHESLFYNVTHFIASFLSFSSGYESELVNVAWNNSLLTLIKVPILLSERDVPSYLNYIYLIIVITILVFVFVRLYHVKTFWKRVLIICSLMILIPSISGDYNLVFILIPMLLYFNGETNQKEGILFSILFAMLLVPKAYFMLLGKGDPIYHASIQTILNPLLLITLLGCALIPESMNISRLKSIFKARKPVVYQDL